MTMLTKMGCDYFIASEKHNDLFAKYQTGELGREEFNIKRDMLEWERIKCIREHYENETGEEISNYELYFKLVDNRHVTLFERRWGNEMIEEAMKRGHVRMISYLLTKFDGYYIYLSTLEDVIVYAAKFNHEDLLESAVLLFKEIMKLDDSAELWVENDTLHYKTQRRKSARLQAKTKTIPVSLLSRAVDT